MEPLEEIKEAIEAKRQDQEVKDDYSIELSCVISRLSGLSQLMILCGEIKHDLIDIQADDIAGIGLILSDILGEIRGINQGLYKE